MQEPHSNNNEKRCCGGQHIELLSHAPPEPDMPKPPEPDAPSQPAPKEPK